MEKGTKRGKAKVLSSTQQKRVLDVLTDPRDLAMYLLSVKAALRAIEIAGLRWGHVRGDCLELTGDITKGGKARTVPMGSALRTALEAHRAASSKTGDDDPVFLNRHCKGWPMTANAVQKWFSRLYGSMGWEGYRSHSGRRTAITQLARTITQHGGSLRDVQQIAGHSRLDTTQEYIEGSSDAKKRAMEAL